LPRACADELGDAVAAATREVEYARLKLRLYEREEYPRQLGHLDRAIELAKAKVESLERQVKEYEQFTAFRIGQPLFWTLEKTRLELLEHELTLEALQEERFLLVRHRGDRARMLELDLAAAQARLLALTRP
jgi:hypothetical protein